MHRFASSLAALALLSSGTAAAQPADLLISEYVEGSSFNKAVELYNGTGSPVDLEAGAYTLQFFFNGNTTASTVIELLGSVASGDVFVLAENSAAPEILAVADQTDGDSFFNGDDAVVLFRGEVVVDVIGQVGFDPGTEWGEGDASTADNTLRREGTSCDADTAPADPFDPAVDYVGFPEDAFGGLGNVLLSCGSTPPAIVVDIEPVDPPIVVPSEGGPVAYRVTLTNTTAQAQTFDAWIMATLPNGSPFGPIRGPQAVQLPANQTVGPITFTEQVPAVAPAGAYTVTLNVGDYPSDVDASDSFSLVKLPPVGVAPGEGASGEPFVVSGGAFLPIAAARTAPSGPAAGAYPNPARERTVIRFALEAPAEVRLAVYDALGREVAVLADGPVAAGAHEALFDGSALPAGVYVWRVAVGSEVRTGRLTLTR